MNYVLTDILAVDRGKSEGVRDLFVKARSCDRQKQPAGASLRLFRVLTTSQAIEKPLSSPGKTHYLAASPSQAVATLPLSIGKAHFLAFLNPKPKIIRDEDAICVTVPRMRGVYYT